jgi:hypothetical protein
MIDLLAKQFQMIGTPGTPDEGEGENKRRAEKGT